LQHLTRAHTAQMKLILFEILFRKISRKKFNIVNISPYHCKY